MRLILLTLLLCALTIPSLVRAQLSATPDPLQFTIANETPGPNQLVYIEAAGVGTFLGNATITWSRDGQVVDSGVGHNTYAFTTGGVGSAAHVHVHITSTTNGTMDRDFYFAPSVVNLVWEANTTAPLFYLGKTLYSAGSRVTVAAFPTVASGRSLVAADKLSYQWSLNDTPAQGQSGLGRSVFSFDGEGLHTSEKVSVDLFLQGSKVATGEVVVPASQAQVLLYDRDPLRGEFLDQALPSSFNLGVQELAVQAEPYFFAKNAPLAFSWTLNGNAASGPDAARGLLTVRQTAQGSGSALLGVSIQNQNPDMFAQVASQTLEMAFGQSGVSLRNLFGI